MENAAPGGIPHRHGKPDKRVDADDGEFIQADLDPSSELHIDTGAEALAGNGAPKILLEGESDVFELVFTFDSGTLPDTVVFDPTAMKWQTGEGSFQINDTPPTPPTTSNVPEPATMLLSGIGLLGIARISRKKK